MATPIFAAEDIVAESLTVSPVEVGAHARHRTRRRTTIHIADNEENHEVYTELSELFHEGSVRDGGLFWKETARWMKYEQEFDEGSSQWGHPHVSALEVHSLRVVQKAMEEGLYMLDLPAVSSFAEVVQYTLDEAVRTHQLALSSAVTLQEVLLRKHNHVHESTFWESIRGRGRGRKSSSAPDTTIYKEHMACGGEFSTIPLTTTAASNGPQSGPSPPLRATQYGYKMTTDTGNAPSCVDIPRFASMDAAGAEASNTVQHATVAPLGEKRSASDSKLLQVRNSMSATPRMKQSLGNNDVDIVAPKPMSRRNPSASLLNKLSKDAEGISVMVGALESLSAPLLVFVRLRDALVLNQLTDPQLPTRFICILIGPSEGDIDYHEAGRVLATVLSNESFQCVAYHAKQGDQLVTAFSIFLSEVAALPPGDWDEDALLQFINERKEARLRKARAQAKEDTTFSYDPPKPTFRPFVGLALDLKQLGRQYKADLLSCFHWQCLLATFFTFISCIAPAVAFGGLLQEITENRIGVSEMLVASGVAGIIYGSLAVQPLVILALTGPVLVFEEAVFHFAVQFDVDYLSWRFWIGLWTMLFLVLLAVGEASILIKFFTRFSKEVFTLVVAGFFALQCGLQMYKVFVRNPLVPDQDCLTAHTNASNSSSSTVVHNNQGFHVFCLPNTALFSVILCVATFFVAYLMRKLRHSCALGGQIRQIVSEFGMFTAILASVLVAFLLKSQVTMETLLLGQPYLPTHATLRTNWVVYPLGEESQLHIGAIFGAIIPACLAASLIFIEHQLTILAVTRPHFKLKRGCGYHWDLLLEGVVVGVCSVFGLPWMCGAPIRSVQHLQALSVYSRSTAPGARPRLSKVHEQRVTNITVHVLMILSPWASVVISHIPIPVVLGVFLYLAYISLYGVQLVHRLKLLFIPSKYHRDMPFTKSIRLWKLNVYTTTQLVLVAVLWVVKFTPVAMFYPLLVILLIPIHKFIKWFIFTETEVQLLDKEDSHITDEIDGDEYDNLHVPY